MLKLRPKSNPFIKMSMHNMLCANVVPRVGKLLFNLTQILGSEITSFVNVIVITSFENAWVNDSLNCEPTKGHGK